MQVGPQGGARRPDAEVRHRRAAHAPADRRRGRVRAIPFGPAAGAERGKAIFAEQCAACHGETGTGSLDQGAPNLTDAIWLYGGSKAAIAESIRTGRGGMMPAWDGRLDPVTVKALTVYVHTLGGGK